MNKFSIIILFLSFSFFSCTKANDGFNLNGNQFSKKSKHLELGNPSNASNQLKDSLNYLIEHPEFALSYNSTKGIPNWVAWHLNSSWMAGADRQDNFSSDPLLPPSFYQTKSSNYTNSGFDRGHLCPSADRTESDEANSNTFLMSNIIPQAPNLNRIVWKDFEEYCRDLIPRGYEVYIVSGPLGEGGMGSHDSITNTLANKKISVPAYCWKVALIIKDGDSDLIRIDSNTIILSTLMPNVNGLNRNWLEYITNVSSIEKLTGFDFFAKVPQEVQKYIESKKNFPF